MSANKYVRRANIQYSIIIMIIVGVAIYMNISQSNDSSYFDEPEVIEEIVESMPSDLP